MKFTVRWKPSAVDELAGLWMDSVDRQFIRAAADQAEDLLRTAPEDQGESRSGSQRIMFVDPLGIVFNVQPEDRVVDVLQIWRSK